MTDVPSTRDRRAGQPATAARPARTPAGTADHRTASGRFRNPWPGATLGSVVDFLRWRRTRVRAADPPWAAFHRATPHVVTPRAQPGACTATWIGHSTVLLQVGDRNVLTDPMWSTHASPVPGIGPRRWLPPGLDFEALPPIDLVLLSHNHYDHLDARTARRLARQHPDARWCAPLGLATLLRRWGVRMVTELDWWDGVDVPGGRVVCTPAQHFSGRGLTDRMRSLWCGWALRLGGHSLFFAGDTAYHPAFGAIAQRCGPFDLCLLPIGAYEPRWFMRAVHMDPADAVRAYQDLVAVHPQAPPPAALGIHWGTFKLTDEPMDEPPRNMRDLWRVAGLDPSSLWLLDVGETRACRT